MRACGEEGKIENGLCEKDESGFEGVETEFFMFCN
jgi:hypothetical protein